MGKPKQRDVHPSVADLAMRIGLALVVALVLTARTLAATFEGRVDFVDGLWHFFVCYVLARIGIAVVWQVYGIYRQDAEQRNTNQPVDNDPMNPGSLSEVN